MSLYSAAPPKHTPTHEAGHAVVARALGARRIRLSMGGRGMGARCSFEPRIGPTELEELRTALTIVVAGPAAIYLRAGRELLGPRAAEICKCFLQWEAEPGPGAYTWAVSQLREMFGDELQACRWLDVASGRILERAVEILLANWNEVERLAARLEIEQEISL
jgi:hypothetical protein